MLQVAAGATQVCGSPSTSVNQHTKNFANFQSGLGSMPMRNGDYDSGQKLKMLGHVSGNLCDTFVLPCISNGESTLLGQSLSLRYVFLHFHD